MDRTGSDGLVAKSVFEIGEKQAHVVRRILREFADGRSAIQIASSLDETASRDRAAASGTSTIRGDPKKFVGINHQTYRRLP